MVKLRKYKLRTAKEQTSKLKLRKVRESKENFSKIKKSLVKFIKSKKNCSQHLYQIQNLYPIFLGSYAIKL